MNLLAPAGLLFSLLAVPLIAVYMLRSRRRRQEVSSTMLWQSSTESVSSARPWQRLPITWPLILQLLILAVLVVVLARPFTTEATVLGPHTVFIIDTSGSMAMADRIEQAKAKAIEFADRVSSENLVSVVTAGAKPTVVVSFSGDPAEIIEAVESLEVGGATEDLAAAIRIGRGLATPDRPTGLLLFTDGGDPSRVRFEEPIVDARHIVVDALEDNLALIGFSADVIPGEGAQVFIEIQNTALSPREVEGIVDVDGVPARTFLVETPAGGRGRTAFVMDAPAGSTLVARLLDDAGEDLGDGLDLDNRASAVVPAANEFSVAIAGDGSAFLGALINATPGVSLVDAVVGGDPNEATDGAPTGDGTGPPVAPDVLIVDGVDPAPFNSPAWIINPPVAPPGVTVTGIAQNLAVTYQRPGEPILDHADLSSVVVGEAVIVDAPGWVPIVSAGDVPLVLLGDIEGRRTVYTTFDLTRSNLPVQVAFPMIGSRVLRWLSGDDVAPPEQREAGAPIALDGRSNRVVTIGRPDGETVELAPGTLVYEDTATPGVYSVTYHRDDGSTEAGPTQVRAFSAVESLGAHQDLPVVPPADTTAGAGTRLRELAPLLLVVVLALSFLEWALTHRRRRVAKVPSAESHDRPLARLGGPR